MLQFTKNDIPKIKSKLSWIVVEIYEGHFDFRTYITKNLITTQNRIDMISYIKKAYPNVPFDPVPVELRPLIKVVHDIIGEERLSLSSTKKSKPRTPKYDPFPSFYDYKYESLTTRRLSMDLDDFGYDGYDE